MTAESHSSRDQCDVVDPLKERGLWCEHAGTGRRHAANAGRHPLQQRGYDCYETPAPAVHALLGIESLPLAVWEPACGSGAIVEVLRGAGHRVVAGDIVDRGCPRSHVADFFCSDAAPPGVECIVTNPPYRDAAAFVRHGLRLCPQVVMLLRLAFLESVARCDILDNGQLARVYPFRNRLPMMHRHGWQGPRASSSIPFAWFVWDRDHRGPTIMQRISW
jgi:hypothetical protein